MGLPGFIQKRCSPECSCASLGTCMQMSWVVCTNPLLPVQSWYSPWNGHSALLWSCWGGKRGRSRGGGPCSRPRRLNGSQPANHSRDMQALTATPNPPRNRLHQISKRGSLCRMESGPIMSSEWVMHQEWAAVCRSCRSRWRAATFKITLPQKPNMPGMSKTKQKHQTDCSSKHKNWTFQSRTDAIFFFF